MNERQINKIRKQVKRDSLNVFLNQLKEIVVIPTGDKSDYLYKDFCKLIMNVQKEIKKDD